MMNRIFTLLLAVSCLTAVGQQSYDIIGSSDSTFFLLSDHYLSWNEANDVAQAYDGHLATFTDLAENSVILAEVPTAPEGGYWFGLYQAGEGEEPGQGWGWVTGEALQFTRWAENEPNNVGNEDCGEIYGEGTWNDNACSIERRFIIEVLVSNFGCVNETACNYDAEAVIDDGSCLEFNDCGECGGSSIAGCSDDQACNFNAEAACDDGSCDYSCCPGPGCCDVGTEWSWESNTCIVTNPSDSNFDGCVQLNDLLDLLSAYGDCGAEESAWQCGDPLEYQGYDYETVQIGDQCWFAENLRAQEFRNGVAVPFVGPADSWYASLPQFCHWENDDSHAAIHGNLYNWFAATDGNGLCPTDWHVPSDDEWTMLEEHIGVSVGELFQTGWRGIEEGLELKATSEYGSNIHGFNALISGYRCATSGFCAPQHSGFWTSSEKDGQDGWARWLGRDENGIMRYNDDWKQNGNSVRCIKDAE